MALIFLLLIGMLAIAASRHALLQERMAGSLRHALLARWNAEAALRGAEYTLWSMASRPGARLHCEEGALSPDDGCIVHRSQGAPYAERGDVRRFQSAPGWLAGIGVAYRSSRGQPADEPASDAVYIIEDLGSMRPPGAGDLHEAGNTGPGQAVPGQVDIHVYRITARATGGRTGAISIVQSTFDAPSNP